MRAAVKKTHGDKEEPGKDGVSASRKPTRSRRLDPVAVEGIRAVGGLAAKSANIDIPRALGQDCSLSQRELTSRVRNLL